MDPVLDGAPAEKTAMSDAEIAVARMRVLIEQRTAIIAKRKEAEERLAWARKRAADAEAEERFQWRALLQVEEEIETIEASPAWATLVEPEVIDCYLCNPNSGPACPAMVGDPCPCVCHKASSR